jgi:hypothetical protein
MWDNRPALTRQTIKQRVRRLPHDPKGISSMEIHALIDNFISTAKPL